MCFLLVNFWSASLLVGATNALGSSCMFPATVTDSVISLRSPGFFYWRMILDTNICLCLRSVFHSISNYCGVMIGQNMRDEEGSLSFRDKSLLSSFSEKSPFPVFPTY